MPVALASQLREGTKKAHTMAENTGFVSCFLKGVVDKASYRTLVADLWFLYSAMEEEIGRLADHPVVGPINFAALNRRESLEQDLAFYFGPDWRNQIRATAGAQEYVARIHRIATRFQHSIASRCRQIMPRRNGMAWAAKGGTGSGHG